MAISFLSVDDALTTGKKVIALQKHLRLSQSQMGEVMGVSRGTIAAYSARGNANPETAKIRALADRFGIPIAWFYDEKDTPLEIPEDVVEAERAARDRKHDRPDEPDMVNVVAPADMTRVEAMLVEGGYALLPTWDGTIAGFKDEWQFADEELSPPTRVPSWLFTGKDPKRFIACRPKGLSMAPRIGQGDVVVIRLESNPAPGEIIVPRREDGVNFIKVFRISPFGVPELHSINGDFPIIAMEEEWVCKGVVVAILKPYVSGGTNIEFNDGTPLRG